MAWRDTMRPIRLLGMDARVVWLVILFAMHKRWWTFILLVIALIAMVLLERRGMTVPAAQRWLLATVAGRLRPGRPWWRKRYPIDYDA